MLLPSDVARLVLGYLQEEGLSATTQAFIHESPNLKEYADHTIGDGTIPACVFSIFGKGLTTILNEYVATKSKESRPEVPAVMTSLWKKLDFTLNQIKQQVLTVASADSVVCSSVSVTSSIVSPAHTSHSVLSHSTPLSFTAQHSRPAISSGTLQQIQDVRLITSSQYHKTCNMLCFSFLFHLKNGGSDSQLVIQNARDKILGDRSLQEKLAENINKILASDPVPQTSKASSSTVEADPSIDEILGLQGEIHMSDDAIHDILEQTESDPAFQALYDLFDFSNYDLFCFNFVFQITSESHDGLINISACSIFSGATCKDANALDTTPVTGMMKTAQERKTRESTAPTLLKKTILGPSGRSSRIENSSARLLVSHKPSSAALDSKRKEKASLLNNSIFLTQIDIDEPLNAPPPISGNVVAPEPATKDNNSNSSILNESSTVPSSKPSDAFPVPEATPTSNVDKNQESKQAQVSKDQHDALPLAQSNQPVIFLPSPIELNNAPNGTPDLPKMVISTTTASSTHTSPAPSTASAAPNPPISNLTAPSKSGADSSVVSLKIIISDNKDEDSSNDPALSQADSSISGDKIPTIYLSSPAKSPALPDTPKANSDEVAQAVSGLQSSEAHASPLGGKVGALIASPLTGTSQIQQNYIIQLPLDTSTPAIQGATASYLLMTEPPTADAQPTQGLLSAGVSKGQPLNINQNGVTGSQVHSTGAALLLPLPAKPVMLPVSLGRVQMVFISLQFPPLAPPMLAESTSQQDTAKGPNHKRILCFDSSAEAKTATTLPPADNTSTSQPVKQTQKTNKQSVTRTRPTILDGNKPKRRVQTVRCPPDPQTDGSFMKEADKPMSPQQHQQEPFKKTIDKQDNIIHNQKAQCADSSRVDDGNGAKAKDEDSSKKEHTEKAPAKSREGHTEKRVASQEIPNVTANKENEIKSSTQEQQAASSSSASIDLSPQASTLPTSNPQTKTSKPLSKTSSLAKQAAEMLHDIQGLSSPSTPGKKSAVGSSDLSGCNQKESADTPRTPRQKKGKDGEGTPKHLMPNTPDIPSCSPASEAGSENSINMAAHTLMILSRAAITRTGTPLKDSLRQEGFQEKSPTSSKNSKKRKLTSPAASPPVKKDRVSTTIERKKLSDCFPHDLDVDKFLSSLHYVE
uniref:Protein NPAT C-terminal domain-containing protein n=1 Tax=Mola mola TaxID=94237 RepID=A0A3Q3WAM2_MOLML